MVIKYQILGDLNNRKLFLTILEVEKSKMSAWLGSGENSSWLAGDCLLSVS